MWARVCIFIPCHSFGKFSLAVDRANNQSPLNNRRYSDNGVKRVSFSTFSLKETKASRAAILAKALIAFSSTSSALATISASFSLRMARKKGRILISISFLIFSRRTSTGILE